MAARRTVQQGGKQAAAKKVTAKKKVADATKAVKDSREAAKDLEVTDVGSWKGRVHREAVKLLLPSGNVCLAFNEGMMAFIESGKVPNGLLPIIMDAINEGKGLSPKDLRDMADKTSLLRDMVAMTDSAVVSCVLSPEISPAPLAVRTVKDADGKDVQETYVVMAGTVGVDADGQEVSRDPDKLYVDELAMEDKMFLFNWVMGGSKDIERFRQESAASLESVSAK